jgi:hypothetical protein
MFKIDVLVKHFIFVSIIYLTNETLGKNLDGIKKDLKIKV